MKRFRLKYLRWFLLALLLAGVLFFRLVPGMGEIYSRMIYPSVSVVLSWIVSPFSLLLEEILVISVAVFLLVFPFMARWRGKSWSSVIGIEVEVLAWIYVWFYWGWGMNYFRNDFFVRAQVTPAKYEEIRFRHFLTAYTDSLNATFVPALDVPQPEVAETEIKALFFEVPSRFGLAKPRAFQHPKHSLMDRLYSSVGVLGYMGPFFAESYINKEMGADVFTYAHELSHLLGVSSEAEANFWAYQVCTRSSEQAIRHRGYMGLLPYVLVNASALLPKADFQEWVQTIRPEVVSVYKTLHEKRACLYSPLLGKLQNLIYNWYLKGNRISSGQKNYAEVIGMILSLPNDWNKAYSFMRIEKSRQMDE